MPNRCSPIATALRKSSARSINALPIKELEYVSGTGQKAVVAETKMYTVYAVRWPVLSGVYGEGLLLEPKGKPVACVVVVPDADQTPEMWAGLAPGLSAGCATRPHVGRGGLPGRRADLDQSARHLVG